MNVQPNSEDKVEVSPVPPTVMTSPETGNQVTEIIQKLQEIINMYKPKE